MNPATGECTCCPDDNPPQPCNCENKQQKMVRITATNKYGLQISDYALVHKDYTGPDTYDLGQVATLAELQHAFDRYCDAV